MAPGWRQLGGDPSLSALSSNPSLAQAAPAQEKRRPAARLEKTSRMDVATQTEPQAHCETGPTAPLPASRRPVDMSDTDALTSLLSLCDPDLTAVLMAMIEQSPVFRAFVSNEMVTCAACGY